MSFGIPIAKIDTIKVGDIILTNEDRFFGHGAFVNAIVGGKLQLTESNYHYDLRIGHTRQIWPNSPSILGVFRPNTGTLVGNYLFDLPDVNFPVQLRVLFLQNNQPFWNSLLQHMANLQNWFWQASGQRIELIIDYRYTSYKNIPIVYTGPIIGGLNMAIVKPDFMNMVVFEQANAEIVVLNMMRRDWKGTVFDHPEQVELGYAYEDGKLPAKIFTVCDEHDDYPPYYPSLGAYAKVVAHEICHILYGLACSNKFPAGSDLTHNHWFGQNGWEMKPENCFMDFDYSKLTNN